MFLIINFLFNVIFNIYDRKGYRKDDRKEMIDCQRFILELLDKNDRITINEMTEKTHLSEKTMCRELKLL
jgi:hypothetical protein